MTAQLPELLSKERLEQLYEHVKGIAPGQSAVFYEGDDDGWWRSFSGELV